MNIGVCFQGGGGKGAYAAGAGTRLFELLPQGGHTIVHVSGTSIGALNSMMLAQGQHTELRDWWYRGHTRVGIWLGLFREVDRLFNRALLLRTDAPWCTAVYAEGSRIQTRYATTPGDIDEMPTAVKRSMRIPGAFLPERGPRGEWYTDGGVYANQDPRPLIFDQRVEHVIGVFCSPDPWGPDAPPRKRPLSRTAHVGRVRDDALLELDRLRLRRLRDNNASVGDQRAHPRGGTKRHIGLTRVQPTVPTRNGTMTFNGKRAALDYRDGIEAAERAVVAAGLL